MSIPASGDAPPFAVWLKVMADYADVAEPGRLQEFLVRHGCQCTKESAAEWLAGQDPSPEKSRDIIKAFHAAFPELEVWEEYKRFVRGQPYMQKEPRESRAAAETLEQILQKTGLPPPLSE